LTFKGSVQEFIDTQVNNHFAKLGEFITPFTALAATLASSEQIKQQNSNKTLKSLDDED
jgi:hypothetical protein